MQPRVTSVSGDLMPSCGLQRHYTHMCCTYMHADKHQKSLAVVFQMPFVSFGMRCVCLCVSRIHKAMFVFIPVHEHEEVKSACWVSSTAVSLITSRQHLSLTKKHSVLIGWLATNWNLPVFAAQCWSYKHSAMPGFLHEWWGFEFSPYVCSARALIRWAISWASHLVLGDCVFHGLGVWKVG